MASRAYNPAFLQRLFTEVYPPTVAASPQDSGIVMVLLLILTYFSSTVRQVLLDDLNWLRIKLMIAPALARSNIVKDFSLSSV